MDKQDRCIKIYYDGTMPIEDLAWLLHKNFLLSTGEADQICYLLVIKGYATVFTGETLKALKAHSKLLTSLFIRNEILK